FQGLYEVPTDVEEIGIIRPQSFGDRYRPAFPGCAISHIQGPRGTFGCVVSKDGQRLMLSCSHVVAKAGAADIGDTVLQLRTVGTEDNVIGHLAQFIPFDFSTSPEGQVDAALVAPVSEGF